MNKLSSEAVAASSASLDGNNGRGASAVNGSGFGSHTLAHWRFGAVGVCRIVGESSLSRANGGRCLSGCARLRLWDGGGGKAKTSEG